MVLLPTEKIAPALWMNSFSRLGVWIWTNMSIIDPVTKAYCSTWQKGWLTMLRRFLRCFKMERKLVWMMPKKCCWRANQLHRGCPLEPHRRKGWTHSVLVRSAVCCHIKLEIRTPHWKTGPKLIAPRFVWPTGGGEKGFKDKEGLYEEKRRRFRLDGWHS